LIPPTGLYGPGLTAQKSVRRINVRPTRPEPASLRMRGYRAAPRRNRQRRFIERVLLSQHARFGGSASRWRTASAYSAGVCLHSSAAAGWDDRADHQGCCDGDTELCHSPLHHWWLPEPFWLPCRLDARAPKRFNGSGWIDVSLDRTPNCQTCNLALTRRRFRGSWSWRTPARPSFGPRTAEQPSSRHGGGKHCWSGPSSNQPPAAFRPAFVHAS
jgi:hypothetical protein